MAEDQIREASGAFAQALREVPLREMFQGIALGVVDAQAALDDNAIRTVRQMAETTIPLLDADGNPAVKSLLELGFLPSFYHFSEARLEVNVTLSMRTEESESSAFGANFGANFDSTNIQSTDAPAAP